MHNGVPLYEYETNWELDVRRFEGKLSTDHIFNTYASLSEASKLLGASPVVILYLSKIRNQMVSKNAIGYFNLQRDWLLFHCDIIGDFKLWRKRLLKLVTLLVTLTYDDRVFRLHGTVRWETLGTRLPRSHGLSSGG